MASVPHGLRGQPSNRRKAPTLCTRITALMRTTYVGFNDVHLTELHQVHGLPVSRASVRRLRLALGLPPVGPLVSATASSSRISSPRPTSRSPRLTPER